MALARPIQPSGDVVVGPPVNRRPSGIAVTVAMATRPAAHLRGADRRRLARLVSGAERRLTRAALPPSDSARLTRRLWALADRAARAPAREGLALVASADEGRLVNLYHPAIDRVVVGPAPSDEDIVDASWGFGRLAVLRLTGRGSRLICSEGASLWEPRPPWDPLGLHSHIGADRTELLITAAMPARTPLLVAGDDRLVRAFRSREHDHPIVGYLPGDHSETSAATLAALAQRALRRSLDDQQRSAMVSLALAVNRDSAVRGVEAVAATAPGPHDILLVEAGAQGDLSARSRGTAQRVEEIGGAVVVVPDGFLAHHDAAALVADHRVPAADPGSTRPAVEDDPLGRPGPVLLEAVS